MPFGKWSRWRLGWNCKVGNPSVMKAVCNFLLQLFLSMLMSFSQFSCDTRTFTTEHLKILLSNRGEVFLIISHRFSQRRYDTPSSATQESFWFGRSNCSFVCFQSYWTFKLKCIHLTLTMIFPSPLSNIYMVAITSCFVNSHLRMKPLNLMSDIEGICQNLLQSCKSLLRDVW